MSGKIIYTITDEAPALATRSLLPIIQAFVGAAGIDVETSDISLAGRVMSQFPDHLEESQRVSDDLAKLGELALLPEANIIKLPNISASVPQLEAAVEELQSKGFGLPDYPDDPETDEQRDVRARYDRVKGSAVNPVLRQGNSDRRAPAPVKQFARNHPHSMGAWSPDSETHVATMAAGDFRSNELSTTIGEDGVLRIEHVAPDRTVTVLKDSVPVLAGDVVDATYMSKRALVEFIRTHIDDARDKDILFSIHVKATMMKVSDPIIFGHVVHEYFRALFDRHADLFEELGIHQNNGLGSLLDELENVSDEQRAQIEAEIEARLDEGPDLAMVNSDKGITNLHVPSDTIIDASMPAMIRASGQMWNKNGEQQDTKAVIPDSSYAAVFQSTIEFCKEHGAFDPTTMGTVPNVGLMAQKAEEYGSHDKTFEIEAAGTVRVVDDIGTTIFEHQVEAGDIWRMCTTTDAAIRDWVGLGVRRARATGWPAVFWLDAERAHDAQLIQKLNAYLPDHDTNGLQIEVMSPEDATRFSLERVKRGENTVSVTGNVLRDYLTDLFPILEVGTSAKMLSIVPLMAGGGLFETGAGGSAPKHVQQFEAENHLRWDSLGEFLALTVSLEHLAEATENPRAQLLADCLDEAVKKMLLSGKSPSRKVMEIDNRGTHFYLALYWAQELGAQNQDAELAATFAPLAEDLAANEEQILRDLIEVQGRPMDIGGYYLPDDELADAAMRPSLAFNEALAKVAPS